MSRAGYDLLGLMIDRFSGFIEWLFRKRKKSELQAFIELNSVLSNQFHFSIFDIAGCPPDVLQTNLEKIDSRILGDIIVCLFGISISKDDTEIFQSIQPDPKLNDRIIELIAFAENKDGRLSIELSTIKNSVAQHLRVMARNS